MIEFCFETVNWSSYFGCEHPDLPAMICTVAREIMATSRPYWV